MSAAFARGLQKAAVNRKAMRDYEVLCRFEAGIELRGSEVKSIRTGKMSLAGAFARCEDGEVILVDLNIPAYEHAGSFNCDPVRPRKLLLHRTEIDKITEHAGQKGFSIIPLSMYWKDGLVKVEIGVCRGRKQYDKREVLKKKEADREARRVVAARRKR